MLVYWFAGLPATLRLPQVAHPDWLHDLRTVGRPEGSCSYEAVDGDSLVLKADLALLRRASCAPFQRANMRNGPINVKTIAAVATWLWEANVRIPDVNAPGSWR